MFDSNGRGGGIRTPGPLLPKQMRYQAALRPDTREIVAVRSGVFLPRGVGRRGLGQPNPANNGKLT